MEPPSRMKIGRTREVLTAGVSGCSDSGLGSGSGAVGVGSASGRAVLTGSGISALPSEEAEDGDSPVLLVSVDDVGTVVPRAERLRVASLRAEDVVVDMMIRSECDARLSDESFRGNFRLGLVDAFTAEATSGGWG